MKLDLVEKHGTVSAICGGQPDQVAQVERLKRAILDGLASPFYSQPVLPLRYPNAAYPWYTDLNNPRGMIGRRDLLNRGGQLEVAGVVVGHWSGQGEKNAVPSKSPRPSLPMIHNILPSPAVVNLMQQRKFRPTVPTAIAATFQPPFPPPHQQPPYANLGLMAQSQQQQQMAPPTSMPYRTMTAYAQPPPPPQPQLTPQRPPTLTLNAAPMTAASFERQQAVMTANLLAAQRQASQQLPPPNGTTAFPAAAAIHPAAAAAAVAAQHQLNLMNAAAAAAAQQAPAHGLPSPTAVQTPVAMARVRAPATSQTYINRYRTPPTNEVKPQSASPGHMLIQSQPIFQQSPQPQPQQQQQNLPQTQYNESYLNDPRFLRDTCTGNPYHYHQHGNHLSSHVYNNVQQHPST